MGIGCEGDRSFLTKLTTSDVRKFFPDSIEVYTAGQYNDSSRKHGVYIFDNGASRFVRINGACPNLQDGECILGPGCLAAVNLGSDV